MASEDIKEEEADPLAPLFKVIKNDLERMIDLSKEIVLIWDSSEASKKNDEANPLSHPSSEASKKNDEANRLALCSQWIKKKFEGMTALLAERISKRDSSKASKKNDEANSQSLQSSQAKKKNDEKIKLKPEFEEIVSKWDSSLALRSRWIKKKLEKQKDLFKVSSWEDNLLGQVYALQHEVGNLVLPPYDNYGDKLNRIIGDIQRITKLVTPGMTPELESRIRSMISKAIQKIEEAGHPEDRRTSFQMIEKELEKMTDIFDGRLSKCEDNLLSQVLALVGSVDNLVLGPYGNEGDKLNRIIGDIQRIRNLVTPGTAPDLECRILMISEVLAQKNISETIQKKEPADPKKGSRFQKITKEIERMIAQFDGKVSKWEENLLGQVSALERDVDNLVSGLDDSNSNNIEGKLNGIIGDLKRITKLITTVRPINIDLEREKYQPEEASAKKASKDWQRLDVEKRVFENANVKNLKASFDNLEKLELKLCLLFLSIFPENSVIKKRPLIYWWIGEGLIKADGAKTAEEVGDEIFMKLIAENLIIAKFDNEWNWSPVVNRFEVHPWIRRMLISLAKEAQLFVLDSTGTPSSNTKCRRACLDSKSFDKSDEEAAKLLTVFNVNEQCPSFKDADWLRKLKIIKALHLGRWQDSVEHHIEMEDEILKGLGAQKHLKYLSLRGISRITELPDSIVNLTSLEILDLRACHNLERLPDKIASLKKLTHLDVSECYLLESMPKGLEKLTALQVLKGFVVGDSNETFCRMGSLHKLKNLKRLSIRIGKTAVIQNEAFGKLREDFGKLKEIESLHYLTISWVKGPEDQEFPPLSFPSNLEKLDLRGIPVKKAQEWLQPSQLKNLKKLYIRGGELDNLDNANEETGSWKVEILILKYLRNLKMTTSELRDKFPHLRYLEKIKCHENDEDIVWYNYKSERVLWPKEEEKRHAAWESSASSSKS